jgi:SAM-dependent methyltransferase
MMTTYTHGHHESVLRSHRWRTAANSAGYLLGHLRSGDHLLDVGAGPGTITADLARLVGRVTATEVGPQELALTAEGTRGLDVELRVADVHALPFEDATFDVAHAHQVLQHVADPVAALREMARVTRPGGLVAARDGDYGGFIWWPRLPGLDDWLGLYHQAARANGGEPDAGRRLLGWAQAAGLTDITATASVWCFATPQDRAWWGGSWAERMTESALARQLIDQRLATHADLHRIQAAWLEWADAPDAWFAAPNAEILARLPLA